MYINSEAGGFNAKNNNPWAKPLKIKLSLRVKLQGQKDLILIVKYFDTVKIQSLDSLRAEPDISDRNGKKQRDKVPSCGR
jgi:hypothetical protein